jgi:hypothetical protein
MLGGFWYIVASCVGLGVLHGVIPDEHTWPITFNYAVGAASGKGGRRAGAWFSLAFLAQRAIMSELIFFAFALFLVYDPSINGPIYVAVGIAMAAAGWLILTGRAANWMPHLRLAARGFAESHQRHEAQAEQAMARGQDMPVHWCLIHGFISGFGQDSGIFTAAIILGASVAPSAALGWLPGAAFGFGTFCVLMAIGFLFGSVFDLAGRWGKDRVARFGQLVGARSLVSGGLVFVAAGFLFMVGAAEAIAPIIDYGTLIVVVCMIVLTLPIIVYTWREVKRDPTLDPSGTPRNRQPPPEPAPGNAAQA